MYCRDCQYDLRGQTDARCPECGRAFDPADKGTFLTSRRGALRRAFERCRGRLAVLLVLAYASHVIAPFIFPRLHGCGEMALGLVSQENLKHIVTQWRLSLYWQPVPPQTPLRMNPSEFEERLSPYAHPGAIRSKYYWEYWLQGDLFWDAAPVLALSASLAILLRRKMRRLLAAFSIVSGCTLTACFFADPILDLTYPGDTSYLRDYDYIPVQNWPSDPNAPESIVAYEKTPMLEAQRIVAFDSGRASRLREDEFQALASAQGLLVAALKASE